MKLKISGISLLHRTSCPCISWFLFCPFLQLPSKGVVRRASNPNLRNAPRLGSIYISHFTALHDGHILIGLVSRGPSVLNHANHVQTIDDLSKDNMLVVQERRCRRGNKELAAIGVWTRVLGSDLASVISGRRHNSGWDKTHGHTEQTGTIMRERKVLVGELGGAVDGARPGPVPVDKVPSLDHEIFDLDG